MRKWLVPVIILAVLLLVITACSSQSTTTTPSGTTTQPPTSATSHPTSTTSQPTSTTTQPTSTTPAGGPSYGGVLKIIVTGSPVNLALRTQGNTPPDLWYNNPAIETLLFTDDAGNLTPRLATGWKFADDYSSVTFTLRQGVKFHDGTDFNAEALKYLFDQSAASPMPEMKSVSSTEVVDPYTLKVNFSKYEPPMMSLLAVGRPGWIVSPTAMQTMTPDELKLHPVGTGPFKFESFTRDVSLKFTRFDNYWQKGKPYLDGIEYIIIPDNTTSLMAFKSHVASVHYNLIQKDAYDLQKQGFLITAAQASIYQWIPDSANPDSPWSNVDVRRAAQYAIDTQTMAKAQGFGWADGYYNQVFPKGNPAYNPDIVGYPYNPDKARQLLAAAGYPKGFKTSLYMTSVGVGDLEATTQNYLAQVGIQAELKPLAGAAYTAANNQGWQNGLYRSQSVASLGTDPGYQMLTYLSSPPVGWVSAARPADMVALLQQAVTEPNDAKRYAEYKVLCKNIIDDHALIIDTWGGYLLAGKWPEVHDDNIRTLWTMSWTPENAWLDPGFHY
jgi:peptide/nickel transport system substrate-binding protein